MSLMCIDLYETDGLLLFRSKSIIFQTIDLERVIEKAENIFNFYLDFNWESRFIEYKYKHLCRYCLRADMESGQSQFAPLKLRSLALVPSSGARCAPSNSTYGSSTARLFPPRRALRSETCGRSAPRLRQPVFDCHL